MTRGSDPEAPLHVVATAGHVDHGKSALITRLTGIDPDRLAEEKRRGLTIDLGFAWCTLPSGREIGFVDVPGHERFVRTMLAGVGPVRLVLFVVAADEGWRRQSEEHLAIVDVLGADGAVVALTKRDLVDEQALGIVTGDVRERLTGTALEGAPMVSCSSVSGEGMEDLRAALDAMVAAAPEPERTGRARLFVDRVFTIGGAGTVVTGTLTGGELGVGDEVRIAPRGARARVRGLQTHRRSIEVARPVSRVAANLVGVDRTELARGDVLGRHGAWRAASVVEVRLRPVRGLEPPLSARGAFTFHAGSAERGARIRLYGSPSLPEEGGFARIRLSEPVVLELGDRFVLRDSGRRATVAGGVVLDPDPPERPGSDPTARLSARAEASRGDLPALLVAERGAVAIAEAATLTGLDPEKIEGASRIGRWWVHERLALAAAETAATLLERAHAERPLEAGVDAAAVRASVARALRAAKGPEDLELADALVDDLVARGELAREGSALRLASHEAALDRGELERLVGAVSAGEPTPPTVAELVASGFAREDVDAAVRAGALIKIAPEMVLTPAFVERAEAAIREAGSAGMTVSAVRERLGTSRRFAVPLLEHLDRTGVTRRDGDLRFARGL